MKKDNRNLLIGAGIIIGAILLIGLYIFSTYNSLVAADENVNNKWSQVQTVYERRADLVPNLVETVKGAANFETSTYLAVTEARTKWLNAQTLDQKVASANELDSAIARLLVTVENYPQLKATQNFQGLQDELANTENKIAVERQRYNDAVTVYNRQIRTFPANMIAGMFGFSKHIYFEASQGSEKAPAVSFS